MLSTISGIATGTATAAGASSTPLPRVAKAAHEFEGQMMKELLKPMTAGSSLLGDEDDSGAGSSGALGEFASEALGRALSDGGGFGIANKILQDLSHFGNQKATIPVTGK
jgi:Rod binding domain-containing protein